MKRIKILLLCICMAMLFTQTAQAKPANSIVIHTAIQGGHSFQYTVHGDEFINWCKAKDGTTIIKDGGTWYFAKVLNGIVVKSQTPYDPTLKTQPVFSVKNYTATSSVVKKVRSIMHMETRAAPAEDKDSVKRWMPANTPLSGDKNALFIRVSFMDTRAAQEISSVNVTSADHVREIWKNKFSIKNYYLDQSKKLMNIIPAKDSSDKDIEIIEIQTTSADFNNLNDDNNVIVKLEGKHPGKYIRYKNGMSDNIYKIRHTNEVKVITRLMELAEKQTGIDFSAYATDKEGQKVITSDNLIVYFIFEGYEDSEGGAEDKDYGIWAHQNNSYYTDTDKSRAVVLSGDIILTKWAMNGEIAYGAGKIPIAATVCHEMGHQLCGLPDLYDTTYKNKGMGGFSIMAYGTAGAVSGESYGSRPVNLDAWSRYYLGWEKPIEVNSSADLYLTKQQYTGSAETVYLVSGPSSQPYQYYLIEVRDPSDETAWDSGLQKSIETEEFFPGVLVIHVDERVGAGSLDEGNDINEYKDGQHQGVIGVWADTDPRSTENTDSYGTQKSLWYEGNGEEGIFPYALNSAKKFLCSLFFDSEESATPQVYTGIKLFNFSEASADMTASLDYEEDKGGNGGSSSGGCSAGFAAMALIALIPVVLRRKK